jgi:hypothetical protein
LDCGDSKLSKIFKEENVSSLSLLYSSFGSRYILIIQPLGIRFCQAAPLNFLSSKQQPAILKSGNLIAAMNLKPFCVKYSHVLNFPTHL